MQNKDIFEYAVIRLVPKVEREEFLNIGVILFSKRKKYLGMRFRIDETKISAFSPDVDIDMVSQYLNAWQQICQGDPKGGSIGKLEMSYRFRWLVAPRSTIIQSSRTHPGICENPGDVLENLFQFYVL